VKKVNGRHPLERVDAAALRGTPVRPRPDAKFIDPGDSPYAQAMVSLAPGAYTLGVRISGASTDLACDAVLPPRSRGFLVVSGSTGGTGGDDVGLLPVRPGDALDGESFPSPAPGGARASSSPPGVVWSGRGEC